MEKISRREALNIMSYYPGDLETFFNSLNKTNPLIDLQKYFQTRKSKNNEKYNDLSLVWFKENHPNHYEIYRRIAMIRYGILYEASDYKELKPLWIDQLKYLIKWRCFFRRNQK